MKALVASLQQGLVATAFKLADKAVQRKTYRSIVYLSPLNIMTVLLMPPSGGLVAEQQCEMQAVKVSKPSCVLLTTPTCAWTQTALFHGA